MNVCVTLKVHPSMLQHVALLGAPQRLGCNALESQIVWSFALHEELLLNILLIEHRITPAQEALSYSHWFLVSSVGETVTFLTCSLVPWLPCCLLSVWHEKHKNTFSFLFQKCVTEECFFFERLESNNYNTYRSRKYSSWYVALKRTGQYKLGSKTGPGQKAILFLPMSAKS